MAVSALKLTVVSFAINTLLLSVPSFVILPGASAIVVSNRIMVSAVLNTGSLFFTIVSTNFFSGAPTESVIAIFALVLSSTVILFPASSTTITFLSVSVLSSFLFPFISFFITPENNVSAAIKVLSFPSPLKINTGFLVAKKELSFPLVKIWLPVMV